MKKTSVLCRFLLVVWLSTPVQAITPIIDLTSSGSVPAGSSLNISLNGLMASASYSVVCYINTSFPFQYLLLSSNFSNNSSMILSYSINGKDVSQGELLVGQNLTVINGKFTNPSADSLIFTNLDQTNPFTVSKCFGIPIQGIL